MGGSTVAINMCTIQLYNNIGNTYSHFSFGGECFTYVSINS